VNNVSVNSALTILILTHSAITGLHFHIPYLLVGVIAKEVKDMLIAPF